MSHNAQILKMSFVCSKGRLRAIRKKPVRPLVEDQVSARKNYREQARVSCVQASPEKRFGFQAFGCGSGLLGYVTLPVTIYDPPEGGVSAPVKGTGGLTWSRHGFLHSQRIVAAIFRVRSS